MQAINLIYGDQVLDDLEFCRQHEEIILRYAKGIMTLMPNLKAPGATAPDPARISGWTDSLENNPQDCTVLREFLARLIRHFDEVHRLGRYR